MITKKNAIVHIIYASQKGNAQSIAEDLFNNLIERKFYSKLSCISSIKTDEELKQAACSVFIGSTTGDGDPPDTACKFVRKLKRKVADVDKFSSLYYTILGLGDTNYSNFCNFGKTLDKLLEDLGGKRFYECGWADDGTGLEETVEPWIEGFYSSLTSFLSFYNTNAIMNADVQEPTLPSAVDLCRSDASELECLSNFDVISQPEKHPVVVCAFPDDSKLSIPLLPSRFLIVSVKDIMNDKTEPVPNAASLPKQLFPLAATEVISANIISSKVLTAENSVKKALEITFELPDDTAEGLRYEPGDTFGVLVKNSASEVDMLIKLLGLSSISDSSLHFTIDPNTQKKAAAVPSFLTEGVTLRELLTKRVDFRIIPKKPFIRGLVEYTSDSKEKRRLMELISKEGMREYNEHIRGGGLSFIDLLLFFRSCRPPLSLVLEHLPKLLPRPYSITSSPLVDFNRISFVFNIIDIPNEGSVYYTRKGICTGWLDEATKTIQNVSLEEKLQLTQLEDSKPRPQIQIYFRNNYNFRLPLKMSTPVIMVGPGTGVAPFMGFLKHRQVQKRTSESPLKMWLFFGCRNKEKDFLYQKELSSFETSGILERCLVSFSREGDGPKYVQDNIASHGAELCEVLCNQEGVVYVCGDAKNMSRDVFDAFVSILKEGKGMPEMEARKFMAQLQLQNRYLQDVWT